MTTTPHHQMRTTINPKVGMDNTGTMQPIVISDLDLNFQVSDPGFREHYIRNYLLNLVNLNRDP